MKKTSPKPGSSASHARTIFDTGYVELVELAFIRKDKNKIKFICVPTPNARKLGRESREHS